MMVGLLALIASQRPRKTVSPLVVSDVQRAPRWVSSAPTVHVDLQSAPTVAPETSQTVPEPRNGGYVYVVIDTETTGLDETKHGVVSIAAQYLFPDDDTIIEDTYEMDPGAVEFDAEALRINGYTEEEVRGFKPAAQVLTTFAEQFAATVGDNEYRVVGANLPFDLKFIAESCKRHGVKYPLPRRGHDIQAMALEDHDLGRVELPLGSDGQPKVKLELLAQAYGIAFDPALAHEALYDVHITADVFIEQMDLRGAW